MHGAVASKSLYDEYATIKGAYYKDIYNDLDQFIGTWKYINGTASLTISLQKKVEQHFIDEVYDFYEDRIVGEYMYVEAGVTKIDRLSNLDENSSEYSIFGSNIIGPQSHYCLNCGPNDRKLLLGYVDPNREIPGYSPEMIFQRVDSNGVQKLKLKFRTISGLIIEQDVEPQFTEYSIPFGEYILIRVN